MQFDKKKISLRYNGGRKADITVRDSESGISKDDLGHIFDAYYRGHNAASSAGDGLGLYVVSENMAKLGGTVAVRSAPGEGSEFTLSLPINM
jgi:signal transduction histidine kinase